MEVAPRYTLLTLLTQLALFTLLTLKSLCHGLMDGWMGQVQMGHTP